jgi:hypothetical protein
MAYCIGDVVLAKVLYEDGTGVKTRPTVILKVVPKENSENRYVVAECYSDKEHYDRSKGVLIKKGTVDYESMCLDQDTFITQSIKAVFEKMIIKKLGTYPRIDWLMQRFNFK